MTSRHFFVIDAQLADYQTVIDGLPAGAEWLRLKGGEDGVLQIARALAGHRDLDSIQIVSHGSAGALYLGATVLDAGSMGRYQASLQAIGQSLGVGGDILLYGCNVAAGDLGRNFVQALAQVTGADVAASENATGAAARGGDWVLERSVGAVESAGLMGSGFEGLLGVNTAPTFSAADGKLTTDFGGSDSGQSIAVQADGKILVGGYSPQEANNNFALARYNVDGSLDTSFDTDGKLTTPFGGVQSLAVQADGKILVVGGNYGSFALARFNANGSLDSSFDADGKVSTNFSYPDRASSVMQQADGKILLAGESSGDFALARYAADGSLDTSFDSDGMLTTDLGGYEAARSVMVQTDGKILLAGISKGDFLLMRYNTDGTLDTSFDADGKVSSDFGFDERVFGATLQADGKILVVGSSNDNFALARYNVNGTLDTSFDADGRLTTDLGLVELGRGGVVQADGKIVVGGSSDGNFALVRYNANGSLDTSFDSDGKVTTNFGFPFNYSDGGADITLQADGKILVAGTSNDNFAVARYNVNGSLDPSFSAAENSLNPGPTYLEPSGDPLYNPVRLAPNAHIFDQQLASSGNYGGATLTLARHGGSNPEDIFSGQDKLSSLSAGNYFSVNEVTVGRVISNTNGSLRLAFNSNATQDLIDQGLQGIAYGNTSDRPPAKVQIDWTFSDGNTGTQGSGGAMSVIGSSTVSITPTNDAPLSADHLTGPNLFTGTLFNYSLPPAAFTDPDREALTYTVDAYWDSLPSWLSINPATGALSGIPALMDVGVRYLRITASDSSGASVSEDLRLNINTVGNVIDGSPGNDRLTGLGGNDELNGLAGNDTLDGAAGANHLVGGDGSDLYNVRDAGDIVTETSVNAATGGTDMVYSYLTEYTLTANVENGRSMGDDWGMSALSGNALNNLLYAGAGYNRLDGGGGVDTVSYAYATAAITVSLATELSQDTGGSGIDTLHNIENLTGSNYADILIGNAAANTLNGGGGADVMSGGDGSDSYSVDDEEDVVSETNPNVFFGGSDTVNSYLSAYTLTRNVENGRLLATGPASLAGNTLDNVLYAGAGNNTLDGAAGVDTVSYLYAGAGVRVSLATTAAQATLGSGIDLLLHIENLGGSKYADSLTGSGVANVLDGGLGNDSLSGGLGNDTYVVNTTADLVTELAGQGTDLIQSTVSYSLVDTDGAGANGGNVENLQLLGSGTLNATGNALANLIYAGAGNNVMDGGAGTDTLSYAFGVSGTTGVTVSLAVTTAQTTRASGSDTVRNFENLSGSAGADTLAGNSGNNVLSGGGGQDRLSGNGGNDTFDFNALGEMGLTSTSWDIITDFNAGDRIDLATLDANTATTADDAFTTLIGSAASFSAAGQLKLAGGVLYGNTDADGAAEFAIQLSGVSSLGLAAFVL